MHPQPYPTRPTPEPALHLLGGIWIASCPTCGWQLTTARTQARCERRAARRRCPVCRPEDADAPIPSDDGDWITVPRYLIPDHPELQDQLDDLVEWIAANGGFDPEPS